MDIAVLGHGAGVVLDLATRLDFRQRFGSYRHERHAAERTISRMVVLEGYVLRHGTDVNNCFGIHWS